MVSAATQKPAAAGHTAGCQAEEAAAEAPPLQQDVQYGTVQTWRLSGSQQLAQAGLRVADMCDPGP
jgi:hypothetical protein